MKELLQESIGSSSEVTDLEVEVMGEDIEELDDAEEAIEIQVWEDEETEEPEEAHLEHESKL